MNKSRKRSPLKRPNRRLPGQSLDDRIRLERDRFFSETLFPAVFCLMFAALEWIRWHTGSPPNPWLFSAIAIGAIAWATYRTLNAREKIRRLILGRDGERAVAQTLDLLKPLGYVIYNDIQGPDWNIDHLLIGPSGVYTIETKTLMKPWRGRNNITYHKDELRSEKFDLSQHLHQAKAQSNTIKAILNEYAERAYYVQPVVLFPGWFIEGKGNQGNGIWVLEPKAFLKWVRNAPEILSKQDQKTIKQVINIQYTS